MCGNAPCIPRHGRRMGRCVRQHYSYGGNVLDPRGEFFRSVRPPEGDKTNLVCGLSRNNGYISWVLSEYVPTSTYDGRFEVEFWGQKVEFSGPPDIVETYYRPTHESWMVREIIKFESYVSGSTYGTSVIVDINGTLYSTGPAVVSYGEDDSTFFGKVTFPISWWYEPQEILTQSIGVSPHATVPEPASLSLIVVSAFGLLLRKRRKF